MDPDTQHSGIGNVFPWILYADCLHLIVLACLVGTLRLVEKLCMEWPAVFRVALPPNLAPILRRNWRCLLPANLSEAKWTSNEANKASHTNALYKMGLPTSWMIPHRHGLTAISSSEAVVEKISSIWSNVWLKKETHTGCVFINNLKE